MRRSGRRSTGREIRRLRARRTPGIYLLSALLALAAAIQGPATAIAAPEPAEVEQQLATGKYDEAAAAARAVVAAGAGLPWRLLLVRALARGGQREKAATEARALLERYPSSLVALELAGGVFEAAGDEAAAREARVRARAVASAPGVSIQEPEELVAAGQAALRAGDEPKAVLAAYFRAAIERDAACKAAYLAAGELALAKHDDGLAADWFRRGLAKLGPDADLSAGLARAHYQGDRREMIAALDAALHLNPRHVPALLLRAEHEIDGEDYAAARQTLARVVAVDAREPSAWAFEAVLAHLRGDRAAEERARQRALSPRAGNPGVDALIGRKLSQKYRFSEGAAYQRRALGVDPQYLPAKAQLAQDLLRLGKAREPEGWSLAEEVHRRDGYDVAAYNLATLRGQLAKFTALERKGFVVRMDPREARIYGDEVLALLEEASRSVDAKYGFSRKAPVAVEIFPDQADFAVRTFGMPGGAGYLGVCFGPLITMNSPAGTGAVPVSWRSVLWHEYAHVVTLGLTGNRIPRWLSEGISVHEELVRDPTWGQRMTPRYRQMILDGELTPVGKLSSAFLAPRTPEHLVFAYYQSALVVEFLVRTHGTTALKAILGDLGRGVDINQALEARAAALPALEKGFEAFARARAKELAPRADFTALDAEALRDDSGKALRRFRSRNPDSVPGLLEEARRHLDRAAWKEAQPLLERAIQLAPDPKGLPEDENPYLLLAGVHRRLGRVGEERKVLERLAELSSDAVSAYRRLLELAEPEAVRDEGKRPAETSPADGGDVDALGRNADRLLGVNPMVEAGWRGRGRALEARAARASGPDAAAAAAGAVTAYQKLLLLDPADQADTRFRLARLLQKRDPRAARRHLLEALAEAPRMRKGYDLLLELAR